MSSPSRSGHLPLFVVSNREPYLHRYEPDRSIVAVPTAGGVSVALDALMRERGGVWIAHGAGDADLAMVDSYDRVFVPPDAPAYTLRRVWLSQEEEAGYYSGFSNEGLWPLCHIAHVRPVFRLKDWKHYQAINSRFARAIDEELTETGAPVFINDYHLALVASELRARRPDMRSAHFWHIPWPHPDRLQMCPWRREILSGLLANDLVAFQLERDKRNFLLSAREELSLDVNVKEGVVRTGGRTVSVCATPIGVDYDRIQRIATDASLDVDTARLRHELEIDTQLIGVGVDRLDYTKGIPERLDALDLLLTRRPDLRDRLTFVQVGVPSRSKLKTYRTIEADIDRKVAEINVKHGRDRGMGPVRYRKSALKLRRLVALYRMAHFCIVSSLHDGMNLVAKEYVAARENLEGVLVLSELAGAAQELKEAVLINPYDVEGFAASIEQAVDMPVGEQQQRMRELRRRVAGRDVFLWASDILEELESLRTGPVSLRAPASVPAPESSRDHQTVLPAPRGGHPVLGALSRTRDTRS